MNFLGKVFVVLILIMSIVFMSLAMAVYATHKNWKDLVTGPQGLQARLTQLEQEKQQLIDQHNRRVEELQAAATAEQQQAAKLATERDALISRNAQIQAERDQLLAERRDATAAVAATQANNERLSTEVTGLRDQIRTEEQERDQAFATMLAATEELHQVAGQYERAKEMQGQLTEDVAGMTRVMEASGINPGTDPSGVVPTVDGVVSQVRRTDGTLLVEVTIGADDGIQPGNTVEVFRGTRYLGRLEILRTSPDKAVGRVNRRFQQGQIQEGDRVATRLRVG
jgi:hypothetical protein